MEKLSVYLITKNSAPRLRATLRAVSEVADEIIIVDSGSTDETKVIAKEFKAKFFFKEWHSYCEQKSVAEQKCQYKWVLNIDDDEVLSPELIEEIKDFKHNATAVACRLRIGDMFKGYKKPRRFGRFYNIVRMYNRDYAFMPDDLNTEDRVLFYAKNPKIHQFKAPVYHYSFRGLSELITKLNSFTDGVVKSMLRKKKKYRSIRVYTEFPVQFLKYYFLKRYIFNGYYGFIVSITYSYFRFVRIAKYMEARKKEKEYADAI